MKRNPFCCVVGRALCLTVLVAAFVAGAEGYRFVAWNVWEDYKGNPVAERADRQVGVLRRLRPDFLSLQEFDRGFWKSTLAADFSRDHWVVGRGRGPCGIDALDPVFCRKDRFDKVAEGSAWFHPELDCEKGVVWGVFEDRATHRRVLVYSSHFWWQSKSDGDDYLRVENARRLHDVVEKAMRRHKAEAAVGGGDLNCDMQSKALKELVTLGWRDAQTEAPKSDRGPTCREEPVRGADGVLRGIAFAEAKRPKFLDHAFYTPKTVTPVAFAVDRCREAIDTSDHMPVVFDFALKPHLKVEVTTDATNALYACGAPATFSVRLTDGDTGLPMTTGVVRARLDNFGERLVAERAFDLSRTNGFAIAGTLSEPGFLRLTVSGASEEMRFADNGTWNGGSNFTWSVGYEPERIRVGSERPADFDAFWAAAKAKFDRDVPKDMRIQEEPSLGDERRKVYSVSFAAGAHRWVHGWLSVPREGTGPFPVQVNVPGAGIGECRPYGDAKSVSMVMNVHTYAQPEEAAERLREYRLQDHWWAMPEGVPRYCMAGIHKSREDYFYYPVILGINRAIDWLWERPECDRSRFAYLGTSQGGGFGLALVALNGHFTRAVINVPAITDFFGYRVGRRSGWPRLIEEQAPEHRAAAELNAPYFDGAHFAAAIMCPVRIVVGLADNTCPPAAVYSAFNALPVEDKRIIRCIGGGHAAAWTHQSALRKWHWEK